MLCCGYTLTDFPISIRLTSLALWQSNDCPSASKATLMNMDKYFMWIHYERLHNHNKAKHNKTVCIFLGIYCMRYLGYKFNLQATPRLLISRCQMAPTHRAILSRCYWMHAFAKPLSWQKRGHLPWYNKFLQLSSSHRYGMHAYAQKILVKKIIQHQHNEMPLIVLFTCHTISLFRLWNTIISFYNEITQGVFISRYIMIPQNSHGESFYDITK